MAVNRYFNQYPSQERINNEHLLMEDLIVESIQIMGHNVYYIPRESFDEGDMIFGEYAKSAFKKAYLIESYLLNVGGHEGQQDFFTKFGLEIKDDDRFMISRRSFRNILPLSIRQRPQEGDLVYVPVLHKMFEIKFVEHEVMFHQVGKRLPYVYELKCEAFRSSQESITTGVEEIDQVATDNFFSMSITVERDDETEIEYAPGEIVFQAANDHWSTEYAHATIKEWYAASNTLIVYDLVGEFNLGEQLIGNTSSLSHPILSMDTKNNQSVYNMDDNSDLNIQADSILDLSETNPFGTP